MARLLIARDNYLYFEHSKEHVLDMDSYNYFYVSVPYLVDNVFCFNDYKTQDIHGFIEWLKEIIDNDFKKETAYEDLDVEFQAEIDANGDFNIRLDLGGAGGVVMTNYIKISDINKENVKSFYYELKQEWDNHFGVEVCSDTPQYLKTKEDKETYVKKFYEKETVEIVNPNENNKDYLCARVRFRKYGKIYTYIVDKFDNKCLWYTEDKGDKVIVIEFVYLNEDELPVPLNKMKKLLGY